MSGLRVAVDARPLDIEYLRSQGIGRYAHGLLSHLAPVARAAGGELVLMRARGASPGAFGDGPAQDAEQVLLRRPPLPGRLEELPEQMLLPIDVRRARAGVHHALSIYRAPLRAGVPTVITIHDVVPLMWPDEYLRTGFVHRLLYRAVRRATRLIAVSQRARADAAEHLDLDAERIAVVPEAADERFVPTDPERLMERLDLHPPYLLWVGGLGNPDPRKNLDQLLDGFDRWRRAGDRPETLALAGRIGQVGNALRERAERAGMRVRLLGFVDDADLPALYTGASCLVTASRYEGFGLPALESIACGTPVVAYAVGALPEVAGPGATLVPEDDVEALFSAVESVCDDPEARMRLSAAGREHAAGFSWRRAAEETWRVYEEAAGAT